MLPKHRHLPQFNSFVLAGFECTSALAEDHRRLDLLGATQHDLLCREDYALLKERGIKTVREGISWSAVDTGNGAGDFSRYTQMMQIAREEGIQQIWDLNHFDFPSDVDPFSEVFVRRFASHARRCISHIRQYTEGTIYIAPINEISFFAWIGADMGWWAPYTRGRQKGEQFKKQLVKAAIAAMDAIWEEDDDVRFIQIDPFMQRFVRKPFSQKAQDHVDEFNTIVRFEAWDLLSGKKCPELGGNPKYVDIIGINYYLHNQEWVGYRNGKRGLSFQAIPWRSPQRISFADMIATVYERYKRPILISETGSFGALRSSWWQRTLRQVEEAQARNMPIVGVCAYPVLDRPADAGYLLPESGLWDFDQNDPSCVRHPYLPALTVIKKFNAARSLVSGDTVGCGEKPMTDQRMLPQKNVSM